jgi:tetratricopeptide (TPR) repeat protein
MVSIDQIRFTRSLVITAIAVALVVLAGAGAWFWRSTVESRGLAAYAEALSRVQASQTPRGSPEARTQAIRELEAVLAEYPSSSAAVEAAYQLGNLRYANREYQAARGAFEVSLAKGGRGTLGTLARAGVAYTWEAEGKFAEAAKAFQSALSGLRPQDFNYEELLIGLARNQELAGQKDAAIATYQRLLKDLPKARRGDVARSRLATLGAAGSR